MAEKKDKRLYAGAQDNGGNLRDPDLFANGWGFRQGGDGNESLIDYTNSDIIYHTDNQTAQNLDHGPLLLFLVNLEEKIDQL